ncbi:Palmitoyltransferase pfa4 [Penicillium daleae]|uniref:Palmitoyltransferase PFA4 n=1 Tax=Penicillium daleae TaxID=63821 RepID=A0AAD6G5A0_9EURO|nr:Palmitoyltransferase pfa4 [Penicillium daleae]KAJ5455602.1 Palmitoyltransferase pfa4 [Penicillium daleae]
MLRDEFTISQLAIPAVSFLISFLAYTSQYFFLHFESAPLLKDEAWKINIFASCIWICYFRACFVNPGRLPSGSKSSGLDQAEKDSATGRHRWCRRCEACKPPRAHHCKTCKRCIPKMDHHCPWTSNCVSHFTFPHFIRFLFYAVVGMGYLETLLWERGSIVWKSRDLPSYLGPSVGQLIHLFLLFVVNSMTVFALFILLVRSLWSLVFNTTTIESWEIERHETLVRRARVLGGYLEGPGGKKIPIRKQEFPYDIGIWSNIKNGMGGSANIISWFWPLAATPDRMTGWEFEINDFEDPGVSWPPPDPDRIPLPAVSLAAEDGSELLKTYSSAREEVEAFRRRQAEDLARTRPFSEIQRRKRFHERYKQEDRRDSDDERGPRPIYGDQSDGGEESWRNAEGERLQDFGVDEEAEFYDEDDVPLGVLLKQRNQGQ